MATPCSPAAAGVQMLPRRLLSFVIHPPPQATTLALTHPSYSYVAAMSACRSRRELPYLTCVKKRDAIRRTPELESIRSSPAFMRFVLVFFSEQCFSSMNGFTECG